MLFLGAFAKLRKVTVSFIMSVRLSARMEKLGSHSRILMKFDICSFFEGLSRKYTFHYNLTKITGTLHDDHYTNFDVLPTVHLSITLVNDQLDAQFFYFIIRLLQSSTCFG